MTRVDRLICPASGCTDTVEFKVRHPQDARVTAVVGHDPKRGGAYVEIMWGGLPVVLDAIEMEVGRDPAWEILDLLVSFGFVCHDDVREAREWGVRPSCWRKRQAPRGVKRILRIARNLDRAAGWT